MTWHELLGLPETVLWAWRKVRRAYRAADCLYDQAELAAFELNLEAELDSMRADFAEGRWTNRSLRLVPQPKNPDKQGAPRMRQYFEVAVRDQVAWAAVATVLGPELDRKMPAWSYGNRLYRAAWYDEEPAAGKASRLNIGPYRHAAGHLYRRFKHSWPLYRRHISLTARRMVNDRIEPELLDEGDRRALDQSEGLPYLDAGHWVRTTLVGDDLYAASFDLMKFYPSIRVEAIRRGFDDHVDGLRDEPKLAELLRQMLVFEVDDAGVSDEMKAAINPPVSSGEFGGIPTGLFVGGFLANVAMLSVDLEADRLLLANRDIAQFRFVDDHEVLAYDFDALLRWIRGYIALLEASGIGVQVEPDKYLPAELRWLIHPEKLEEKGETDKPTERGEALLSRVRRAARVDGRKPTQLMTRTLAQVSMLAATDFDLLTDAGRSQRLEQLEWLLLANIPDQEIRGDTRMAFAAARIALLTPALFRPNDELLGAHRSLQVRLDRQKKDDRRGRAPDEANKAEITRLNSRLEELDETERKGWQTLLDRHFGLLFEAFAAHPDKVRLFLRLIDFCRNTGHDGFVQLTRWMDENRDGDHRLLRCYLGATAIQTLSRHVLTACADVNRNNLLHRERRAAHSFLENTLRADLDRLVPMSVSTDAVQHFQHDARRAFVAALVLGAAEIEDAAPDLAAQMRQRANAMIGQETLQAVAAATSVPIGIWYHWFLSATRAHRDAAPSYWPAIEAVHNVEDKHDWISLRRYPSILPARAWERLGRDPDLLRKDDAGWLMEAARANSDAFAALPAGRPTVETVRASLAAEAGVVTLLDWANYNKALLPNDPRRSEWTALEIVRQILVRFTEFDSPDADELDRLHPENVLIDPSWKEPPADTFTNGRLTWASWTTIAAAKPVNIHQAGLEDYRYRENLEDNDRRWARRLRPVGQLLWGTLRHDFRLPCAWNVRGQERSLVELVAWDLERLPISSFTLKILQACLLPRSLETALLLDFPSLFGNLRRQAADDAEFDRPITSLTTLIGLLERAQRILTRSQMTVLEYEPRQLIPVRLRHIGRMGEGDADEVEDFQ
ncbi:MAG TPA: RNA-directed DNA polymerase [Sphingomicrobium sp.]|nr:RNA-directed DNA polymerase [Sphingomicrobium sp.]